MDDKKRRFSKRSTHAMIVAYAALAMGLLALAVACGFRL
jgi:hypothetical protein